MEMLEYKIMFENIRYPEKIVMSFALKNPGITSATSSPPLTP